MVAKRRFRCDTPGCVGSFTESTAQVVQRRRVTARLCASIARAALDRSTAAVARSFVVGWHTAWRAIVVAARAGLARRPTRPLARLGVDETTFGRYRSYMTGLVDLDTSRLWDFIEGRSKNVLVERLDALGEQVTEIGAVVIDPYASYKAAVRDRAPQATRVADRFHIARLAGQAITDVRCRRQQELTGHRGRSGDRFYAARHDLLRTTTGRTSPTPPGGASTPRSEPTRGTNSNAPGRSKRCCGTSTAAPTAPPPRQR